MPFFPSERTDCLKSCEICYFDPDRDEFPLDFPDSGVTILRGASPKIRTRLLNLACKEALNRELPITLYYRHDRLYPFAARIGKQICLLTESLPVGSVLNREVSVSDLPDRAVLIARRAELSKAEGKIAEIQDHFRLLRKADLALFSLETAALTPCLLTHKLSAYCTRLLDRLRIPPAPAERQGVALTRRICVSTPGQNAILNSRLPAGLRIGLSDRAGIGGLLLRELSNQAGTRRIQQTVALDPAGQIIGLFFPAADLTVGGSPDSSEKPINSARFIDREQVRQARPMLRGIRAQRQEIGRLMEQSRKKIADQIALIDDIFESAINPQDFDGFGKDFLITLFCEDKSADGVGDKGLQTLS